VPARLALTIIRKVSFGPRNSYLKWEGNKFNSTLGVHFLSSLDSLTSILRIYLGWCWGGKSGAMSSIWAYTSLLSLSCTSTLLSSVLKKKASRGSKGELRASISSKTTSSITSTWKQASSRDGEVVTLEWLNSSFSSPTCKESTHSSHQLWHLP